MDEDDSDDVVDCNTLGTLSPWLPFFLESAKLVDAPLADFLPPS